MTFEFDYNTDTEQITIVYDGVFVLKSNFDGDKVSFKNFDKLQDEDTELFLKNLCRAAFHLLA